MSKHPKEQMQFGDSEYVGVSVPLVDYYGALEKLAVIAPDVVATDNFLKQTRDIRSASHFAIKQSLRGRGIDIAVQSRETQAANKRLHLERREALGVLCATTALEASGVVPDHVPQMVENRVYAELKEAYFEPGKTAERQDFAEHIGQRLAHYKSIS